MLDITFHSADERLAHQMQEDLGKASFRLEHSLLLVLLTPQALVDSALQDGVQSALKKGVRLAPVIVQALEGALPEPYTHLPVYDLSKSAYSAKALLAFVNRVDLGEARLARSRNLLIFISISVLVMFAIALWGVGSGLVRFPSQEYATEDAFEFGRIQTLTFPTLDPLMPRTTEDALNFPATVDAAPTRNRPYLRETATALPLGMTQTLAYFATSADMTLTAQASASATPAADEVTPTSTATP
jgi:hypothetical protein